MPIPSISPYALSSALGATGPGAPGPLAAGESHELPWRLERSRAALLVHDMQAYFLAAYRRTEEPISAVIPAIRRLIDGCDAAGVPVFFSAQPPAQAPLRRGLLGDLWGVGIPTAEEAAIIPELAPRDHHHVVTKWRYSAFARTDLRECLAYSGRDQLLITGVYAHLGCQVTAADAFMNDVQPFLVADAIADFSAEEHASALRWVGRRAGRVIRAETVAHHLFP